MPLRKKIWGFLIFFHVEDNCLQYLSALFYLKTEPLSVMGIVCTGCYQITDVSNKDFREEQQCLLLDHLV